MPFVTYVRCMDEWMEGCMHACANGKSPNHKLYEFQEIQNAATSPARPLCDVINLSVAQPIRLSSL